ncbi:MAG: molybdopterin-dependent oxidoreductase, partial [Deltaproteobacteria bacterium]
IRDGLTDEGFIAEHTEEYETFAASVADCTPEWAAEITGVAAADIEQAARSIGKAKRGAVYYTMGITQHSCGTDNVFAIANLVLLTGNIGKYAAGLNPLRGQNNVQGASDMACNPAMLPGYQRVDDAIARGRFEELWNCKLSDKPGLTATEMTGAMLDGKIAGLWIMGENPVLSDPNMSHLKKALEKLEFLVVQDIFLTETAELADVVLPATCFAEKEGTFTNTERRVQRVRRAVHPPGEARDDLSIINMISNRMGYGHTIAPDHLSCGVYRPGRGGGYGAAPPYPAEVFAEISRAWPALAGISYERLEKEGIQWPCPDATHPGTPYLFKDGFPRGKGRFTAVKFSGPKELPDAEYPFVLTTGRVLHQYHTGTMTRRSKALEEADRGPFVEMNPEDAKALGLTDGERVRARSRRGRIELPVQVTSRVSRGVVFIPFHYREAAANLLTNDALDPVCKIPEAKVCAVSIEACQ